MDPNEALAQMREAIEKFWAANGSDLDAAERIAEHAAALDQWLSRKGFLPNAWSR